MTAGHKLHSDNGFAGDFPSSFAGGFAVWKYTSKRHRFHSIPVLINKAASHFTREPDSVVWHKCPCVSSLKIPVNLIKKKKAAFIPAFKATQKSNSTNESKLNATPIKSNYAPRTQAVTVTWYRFHLRIFRILTSHKEDE